MDSRIPSRPLAIDNLIRRGKLAATTGIAARFDADPDRFHRFSTWLDDLYLDYSKTALDAEDLAALLAFAQLSGLEDKRDQMFAGQSINVTENRPVLHTALRAHDGDGFAADGQAVAPDVAEVLSRMSAFADGIRSGAIRSSTGEMFTDVVNIGIGGSDLGPAMATLALTPWDNGPRMHFVSNVDGAHLTDVLQTLDLRRTLFIIASKTFTTIETMTNAATARAAVAQSLGEAAVAAHFCAVSTALDRVGAFGIGQDRTFGFWDWVGGRYSLWSAIGLPLLIAIGPQRFRDFLDGAREMDRHFAETRLSENLPVLLGLVGWWHRVAQGYPTRAVIPYDQRLARLPAYLQQLDMESNGKSVDLDGKPVTTATGPVVWGEPGTNGQHAFFQLLHQGTDIIPVEFLIAAEAQERDLRNHHDLLVANCLAQSEALARGRTADEAMAMMLARGMPADEAERLAPHRSFPGNRPSVTIAYRTLDPRTFGRLLALYEHRVFVEAALFGINAFDQWGVELGKELAVGLLPTITGERPLAEASLLTRGIAEAILDLR
ncbi:glucose-6-phosphate isomerase [Paracoccus sp. SY]|uniref:glucose-6-phosphate isomerase n=1 Tax=Paracoccus sp. SY TaxID=1330255 RepID=UPI000CCFD866|nr:glucose-6-phosphate isomerase [Paracoccus sp. SY]